MKIKTVSRTISFGNFENISMCAEVTEGDSYNEVLKGLELVIRDYIGERDRVAEMMGNQEVLRQNIKNLESDVLRLEAKKTKLCEWAKKHNIKNEAFDDLPF